MNRYFLRISCIGLCLLLIGCAAQSHMNDRGSPPLMEISEELSQYNMTIDFKKHSFSGLLMVKETGEQHIRIRSISHFGLSLFDFGLERGEWKVYDITDMLNHKRMTQLLEHDLKLLLLPNNKLRRKKETPNYTSYTAGRGWFKSRIRQYKPSGEQQGQTEIIHPWIGVKVSVTPLKKTY